MIILCCKGNISNTCRYESAFGQLGDARLMSYPKDNHQHANVTVVLFQDEYVRPHSFDKWFQFAFC